MHDICANLHALRLISTQPGHPTTTGDQPTTGRGALCMRDGTQQAGTRGAVLVTKVVFQRHGGPQLQFLLRSGKIVEEYVPAGEGAPQAEESQRCRCTAGRAAPGALSAPAPQQQPRPR
ncbi:hypothetical protein NDU88_002527 [Pleurodeles waltl]|uniref:Uncharacterized protein n=1 Tax=Pleurodeles waltl TaxID=8319 RepID=A0AAV7LCK7_PLEWA|nr:hypothetical protein NDU88_002527 [Pleurodeles waltl]